MSRRQDWLGRRASGRRRACGRAARRHHEIARANGERIIADPRIALDAITKQQATFTRRDLAMFIHRHSDGKEQFDRAKLLAIVLKRGLQILT